MYNIYYYSYKIDDLTSEKMFMFNVKISACFESTGDCRYTYKVLENTKLPKQPCDWKDGFAVPGMWYNYSPLTPLPSYPINYVT